MIERAAFVSTYTLSNKLKIVSSICEQKNIAACNTCSRVKSSSKFVFRGLEIVDFSLVFKRERERERERERDLFLIFHLQ